MQFFDDTTILIESGGIRYKIFKITPHSDGGFDVHIPYHKDKKGYLFKIKLPYLIGTFLAPTSAIIEQKKITTDVKLSIHQSGIVQFSGKGVISGFDKKTGQPKGLAIKINPISTPITTGPTFGVSVWGLEDFDILQNKEGNKNYISFTPQEFYIDPPSEMGANTFNFECFLFKVSDARQVIKSPDGELLFIKNFPQYTPNPKIVFKTKVIFLKNSPIFIGILPMISKSFDQPKSGYRLGGPSQLANMILVGADSVGVIGKPYEYIHLKAEYPASSFSNRKISLRSLDYKPKWYKRLINRFGKKTKFHPSN